MGRDIGAPGPKLQPREPLPGDVMVHTQEPTRPSVKRKGGLVIIVHAVTRDGSPVTELFVNARGFSGREEWFLKEDGR